MAVIIAETGLQLHFAFDTGAEGCESCVRFTGMYLRNSPIECVSIELAESAENKTAGTLFFTLFSLSNYVAYQV